MNYAFQCKQCGQRFDLSESLAEHERHEEKCPKCGSQNVEQRFGTVYVKTRKKS